jgi:hypothetical protein
MPLHGWLGELKRTNDCMQPALDNLSFIGQLDLSCGAGGGCVALRTGRIFNIKHNPGNVTQTV